MQRKPLFLVASMAETARFLILAFLASALGGLREGDGLPALFRYAQAPQLLFAAAFFFLWLDRNRYGSYLPLIFLGKILSVAAFLPLALGLMGPGRISFPGVSGFLLTVIVFGVDLLSLVLALGSKPFAHRERIEDNPPSSSGTAGPAGTRSPAGLKDPSGPRGPEDVERVEG